MSEIYIFDRDDKLLTIISEDTGLVSATVREELNRVPDTPFSFTIEADSENAQYVKEEHQVVFRDREGDLRLYVIKELDDIDNIDGPQTTATCEPNFVDELSDNVIEDRRFSDKEAQEAMDAALQGTRYTGEVEVNLGLASTNFYHLSSINAIWKIRNTWGGDIKDVVEFNEENNIVARKTKLVQRLGKDHGQRFEIDHNITEIQRTVLSYPKTALYGWGASLETDGGGYTRYIDFSDVEWSVAKGDPVDKPRGQKWVGDPKALQKYGRLKDGVRIHRKGQYSNHDIEDRVELLKATWQQLQTEQQPEVLYKLSVDLFEDRVSLGDTAIAIDRYFSRPIEIQARVIAVEYDLMDPDNTAVVEMGQFLNLDDDRIEELENEIERIGNRPQQVTDKSYPNIKPSRPVNLRAEGGIEVIQLYWDYADEIFIKHYEVYGSQVKDFVPESQHLLWRGQVSAFAHTVGTDQTWYYYVRAVNYQDTPSDWSVKVTASTHRVISDDILFGPDLAKHLRELNRISDIIGEGGVDFENISEHARKLLEQEARVYTDKEVERIQRELLEDLAEKANLDYVDGQFRLMDEEIRFVTDTVDNLTTISDNLRERVAQNEQALAEADGKIVTIETEIDDIEGRLSLTIDELSVIDDTIQNQQIQIEANAEAISLKASQDEVDTLSGNISSMNTTLQILAGEIEMKVSSEELKQVDGRITNLSSDVATLRVSVDGMSSSVSSLQYDLNGVINRVSRAESSIEQNAEAIKQRVTRTEFEQIEIYRIVSVRYNNSGFQRYHKMSGLYRGDTTLWGDSSGNDRSYTLSIYDRSSRTWESHTRYDIYTDENEALLLAEHLNSLGNDKLIILVGAHAAEQNRLTNGLPKAIYRCGGSRDVFEVAWGNTRKEYILVGIAGMGEGKGNEYLSSTDVPWLDVQLIINGGNVQFNNYHENTLTRLTHAESSIEQNAEAITQRVTVSQYSTDQNGVITRLNDAESSIEHNAEAITQRITLTQLNNGLDRKGKLFRAVARAWNGGGNNRYPVTSGLHDEEGNHISYENAPTSSSDRSYILYVMNRSTENWVLRKLYDVYTTNTEATRLANDLARYDENYLVILIAGHSPERNRLAGGLPAQIRRCGGSREIFNESEGWGGGANYILIGIPGMGEGAGLEYFRPVGTTINYGGWLDVTFTIKDGTVDFGNNDGSLALSRVSRAESSITQLADKIELKVDVDGIVSAINLSKEGIRIQGSLIHLDGLTLIDNGIIQNAHIANLSATKITTGTMHGNRIQVNTLNGNRITAGTITADHLNVANLSAVSSNLGTVRAGRLLSNNNNMDLNLNTGNLTMQNANLTIANGAKIDFDDPGNRITYRLYDSTSSLTRSAGMGVGNRIGGRYPFVYIGTTGASELDTLNQFFTGLIVNTSAAIANDDAAISLNGNRVQLRNQATGFEKGVTFDWSGNNPTMSFMNSAVDYAYDIRTLNQLYVRQTFVVRNTTNQLSGWRLESAYSGQGRDITLRGLNGGSYNYQIGENSQTHAIRNIYLRNNPVVVSDSRLKTDIKANTLGLDFINSIETVTYQLTRDKDGTNTGVVAQNILSALDTHGSLDDYKMVQRSDEDGFLSVRYEQLIAPTIRAIQELDVKVNDEVNNLKLKIQYLEMKIKQLEENVA